MSTGPQTPTGANLSKIAQQQPYSAEEERRWNRLGMAMFQFHEGFKHQFNDLYQLADGSFAKRMSLLTYLHQGESFHQHLTAHHTIEERFVFPLLAKRMPSFAEDDGHVESHKGIHKGLDNLSVLLTKYKAEPSSYKPEEMKDCLDGFRDVLFRHLDEEVADLSGENMKKYWTLEEFDGVMARVGM